MVQYADYYPGGMLLPGRYGNSGSYRYAFNGMETDGEVSGSGNSYTTQFRQYDPRLGRWKSLDPLAAQFPWQSPFCGMDNNPIALTDPFGLSTQPIENGDGGGETLTTNPDGSSERRWLGGYSIVTPGDLDDKPIKKNIMIVILAGDMDASHPGAEQNTNDYNYGNWKVFVVHDIVEGEEKAREYLGDEKAKNLVVETHGQAGGISVRNPIKVDGETGDGILNSSDIKDGMYDDYFGVIDKTKHWSDELRSYYEAYKALGDLLNTGGNLFIQACHSADDLGDNVTGEFAIDSQTLFGKRFTIYSNIDASHTNYIKVDGRERLGLNLPILIKVNEGWIKVYYDEIKGLQLESIQNEAGQKKDLKYHTEEGYDAFEFFVPLEK